MGSDARFRIHADGHVGDAVAAAAAPTAVGEASAGATSAPAASFILCPLPEKEPMVMGNILKLELMTI